MTAIVSGVERCKLAFECPCCLESQSVHVESADLAGAMAWVGFEAVEVDHHEYQMEGTTVRVCVECDEHKHPCYEDPHGNCGTGHDPKACGKLSEARTIIRCECCQGRCPTPNLRRPMQVLSYILDDEIREDCPVCHGYGMTDHQCKPVSANQGGPKA